MKRLETELTKAVADLRVSLNTHPWMRESKGELLESLEHSLLLLRIDGKVGKVVTQ